MKAHRTILLLILLAHFLLISAKTNIEIIGKIDNSNKQIIYLKELVKGKNVIVDSMVLPNNGKFNFNVEINNQGFYMLQLSNEDPNNVILIILDTNIKDNKLLVFADANTFTSTYDVKGSEECSILRNYIMYMNDYGAKRMRAYNVFSDKSSDQAAKLKAKNEIELLDKQRLEFRNNFINSSYNKLAVVIVLGQLNINQDLEYFKKIEKGLAVSSPNSEFHISVRNQVKQAEVQKQQELEKARRSELTNIGSLAPELNFPNPEGKIITLESLRGNYVLIDFWASWCGPCRRENPSVVKLYNKYKDKGFTVYSVSLDKDKNRWIGAIKQDGLIWPNHVSDLKQWRSESVKLYGFSGIPYTVLIDKEGKIVAKKLRGQALEHKLQEIFGE